MSRGFAMRKIIMAGIIAGIMALAVSCIAFYLAILATIAIMLAEDLSRMQKAAQLAFSWLLPMPGPAFVLRLMPELSPNADHTG